MILAIATDHAAVELKKFLMENLGAQLSFLDLGPNTVDSVDYPDYAEKLCRAILEKKADAGILICGSGIGMSIAANKFHGIRAALVEDVERAKLSREHNDANVLCLAARFLSPETALKIVEAWVATPFSNAPRHLGRIQKITALEK